jgi:hypothetical protein
MATYFEKLEGLSEVSHIYANWWLFGSYWNWDLIGRKHHEERRRNGSWRGTRCRDQTHPLQRLISTSRGDIVAKERSDDEQYFTHVRWEVESVSGQHEEVHRKGSDSELHLVIVPRMRPITVWGILEFSVPDWTLEESVRSFASAQPVATMFMRFDSNSD